MLGEKGQAIFPLCDQYLSYWESKDHSFKGPGLSYCILFGTKYL